MITFKELGSLGRMGNMLFQSAATIALAKRHSDDYLFPHCSLEKFTNIPVSKFSNNLPQHTNSYQEPYFHYKEIPYKPNMNLGGSYFQSYKYFEDCKEEIINLMMPPHHFERDLSLCALHVRRGDYIKLADYHPTQPMSYYEKAIELSGSKRFLVFSDDIEWCKKNFIGNQFEFAEGNSDVADLALMAKKCESNIICNSSFSWWGAYLNTNPNKKVIYPSNWFGPKLNHSIKDLCPSEWIKI